MRKWIVIPVVAGAMFAVGAAAMAATGFEVGGTAKVTGSIGTVQSLTGTTGTLVGAVFPGHSNDCNVTLTNPNPVPVVIDALTPNGVHIVAGPTSSITTGFVDLGPSDWAAYGTIPVLTPGNTIAANSTSTVTVSTCITANPNLPSSEQGDSLAIHYDVTAHTS